MMIGFVLFWALVIAGTVWLVRRLVRSASRDGRPPTDESPEVILERRYARGEIDSETYERMRKDLGR